MKKIPLFITLFSLISFGAVVVPASAHQPRIVESEAIQVIDPEISKAYYGELSGEPHVYTIESQKEFNLYIGILLPDAKSTKKDVKAEILKEGELIATLGGSSAEWKPFFEPFGQSKYFEGGEYKARAPAGKYTVRVSSTNNDSKYSLAVGEIESFDREEGVNALAVIPDLKRTFFEESPVSFILSPFGWGYVLMMYILAFITGFLYRAILKKFAKGSARGVNKNMGNGDRLIRMALWLGLLMWAITTSWNPILLFFSGFALFEAIFSWCGFYAAIGKNTCPR